MRTLAFLVTVSLVFLPACSPSQAQAPATAPQVTAMLEGTPQISGAVTPVEALQILEPGPGARVSAPLHIAGLSDPTFEQNLVVRVLDENGTQLAQAPTTIQAEAGLRGGFAIDLPLPADVVGPVFVQVFATSPRDGGITHLDAVIVNIVPPGSEEIRSGEAGEERIQIFTPQTGQVVSGGSVMIEGYGWASFEQTLVAELYDEQGALLVVQPLIVQAPDLGQPGPFGTELSYSVTSPQAGRLVVRDPSAAFGGDMHLSSVEIRLEP